MKVLDNIKTNCLRWSAPAEEVFLEALHYPNGRLGLQIMGWYHDEESGETLVEPIATATVNLPEEQCPPGEVWVKDWSENEGMVEQLIEWEVIEPEATATAVSGFVAPLRFKLTKKFLEKLAAAGFEGFKS